MPSIPSRLKLTLAMIGGTLLGEVLNDLDDFPDHYRAAIKIGCRTVLAILSVQNLFSNPDGSHASEPYQPNQ